MKILVIRTDRIGEVLLTTPILTALKEKWSDARISMMIRSEVRELIEDNPNVNEIIEYVENSQSGQIPSQTYTEAKEPVPVGMQITKVRSDQRLWLQVFRMANILKKKKFDTAIIVNPKKEFHLAAFLAGIPIRVGFDRKWGFLLTHRVRDLKALAKKHEVEYNLDLVRALGIEPGDKRPVLVVKDKGKEGLIREDKGPLIAIHPCTSNPKKEWPKENFAKLGDLLMEKGNSVAVVSGVEHARAAKEVISMMKNRPIDLCGKIGLKELAALFKKCKFLVSADSGPVHIAAAVGTRVVALFGRGDPGSNPVRWGPYGKGHIIIQKKRLEDISPEEVFNSINSTN